MLRPLLLCLALAPAAGAAQAQTATPPAGVPVAQSILDGYAGWYRTGSGIRLHVWREDKGLRIQADGQDAWTLVAESETIFVVPDLGARVPFGYDAANRPGYLVLSQPGSAFRAIRE
ncbi:hypothetical protein CSC71_05375 [Pseudoxanthomonas sangjuensis]|uniref:hypothetical protein n=1 Tax=Pseudoxanthomonas sangjuensis TaxID=1503750 RepID=UPI001390903F|nr:hypothetical protein [Pseudoxanthomonas sangjuensis]KAF1714143.1 hypothetical protein CSC71_05375 [Pseudoxanthomonas sangjuensis]